MREGVILAHSFKGFIHSEIASPHELVWTFRVCDGVELFMQKKGSETGWRCQGQDRGTCSSDLLHVIR